MDKLYQINYFKWASRIFVCLGFFLRTILEVLFIVLPHLISVCLNNSEIHYEFNDLGLFHKLKILSECSSKVNDILLQMI